MTILDRPTLDFLLYDWLGGEALLTRPAFAEHNRESVASMLDTAARLAETHFLPCFKKSDREEPSQNEHGAHVIPEIRTAITAYAQ
ncbi:MAG TPA: acyl-CoA dehydrogenase family protein, partial [Acetobacteraceae bacterium]|nr:acyl-CoA dehydrogenase family protein [Acetobacteraceae bacterium]